jgi:hypothetical protein
LGTFAVGFAHGVYLPPILTAPPLPEAADIQIFASAASFKGGFARNLKGSHFLH